MGLLCRHKDGTLAIPCFISVGNERGGWCNADMTIGGPKVQSWSEVRT